MSATNRPRHHRRDGRGTPAHEQLLREEARFAGGGMSRSELADFILAPDPAWQRYAETHPGTIDDRAEGRARDRAGYWDADIEDRHVAPGPYPGGGLL